MGPVIATTGESAAATHCGIGFKVNAATATGKPEIEVYNTFCKNKWVGEIRQDLSYAD